MSSAGKFERTVAQLRTLHPSIQREAATFVYVAHVLGVPFQITEGRRSLQRQHQLLREGRSQTLASRHLSGRAFDIDVMGVPPDNVPQAVWDFGGVLGEALGLRWGGRWASLRDFRHFER